MGKKLINTLMVLASLNANASTLYLESSTPYPFNSKEYGEFRENYESKLSSICKNYLLERKFKNESFAREVYVTSKDAQYPFEFRISPWSIEFQSAENSPYEFYAKCRR